MSGNPKPRALEENAMKAYNKAKFLSILQFHISAALVVVIFGFLAGCGEESSDRQESVSNAPRSRADLEIKEAKGKENLLLFFINPNGAPCQTQDRILQSMKKRVESKVRYVYISVNEADNRPLFYEYGVRALPYLVILDKAGKPVSAFPPGIQSEAVLMSDISRLP